MENTTTIPTESMMKIFVPIWNQVTELLTVASGDYEPDESNLSTPLLHPLLSMSEDILRCLHDLSVVCQQTVTIDYPSDAVAKKEVDFCSQNLMMAGESLVLACHILCSTNKSEILLKTPVPHQMDICGCLSDLYQCMLLLLLAIDDAEVRKIIHFGLETTKALTSLVAADNLQGLNDHFRSLGMPATNFYKRAVMRCNDIGDKEIQYELRCAIATLRQSLPMLTAALQMAIKYPDNPKLLTGRNYCVEQVHKSILEINKKVAVKHVRHMSYGVNCGSFHENQAKIKELLSSEKNEMLDLQSLRSALQNFVQQMIELSLCLSKAVTLAKSVANNLVTSCRKIMKGFRELEKVCSDLEHPIRNEEVSKRCISLIAVSEAAMLAVADAVTALVVFAFTPVEEPVVQLVDACVRSEFIIADTKTLNDQRLSAKDAVTELSKKFLHHIENIEKVVKFSVSCCQDAKVYQKYKKSVRSFQDLSKAIVTASSAFHTIPAQSRNNQDDDLVQNDQILDLQEKWMNALDDVTRLVVFSLDIKILLETIVKVATDTIEKCMEGIVNLDQEKIAKNLHLATGQSTFMVKVGFSVVSMSIIPVYRNGILSHAKKLKNAITSSIAFGNQLLEDLGHTEHQELFMKTMKSLLECLQAVSNSILSTDNHPELTSTNRHNVRAIDTSFDLHSESFASDAAQDINAERTNLMQLSAMTDLMENMTHKDFVIPPVHEATLMNLPFPKPINPIIDLLISSLDDACQSELGLRKLQNAKALFIKTCELITNIAENSLLESSIDTSHDQERLAMKRSSDVVESLKDLILKDTERITESISNQTVDQSKPRNEIETLYILASQWSAAADKIVSGCMTLLPLHIVPIRRYCVYFLDALTDQQKDVVTKSLVPYPGYRRIIMENVSSLTHSQEWDDVSSTDFKVHERNIGELIRLIEAISDMAHTEIETEKLNDAILKCEAICEEWKMLCDIKEEIVTLISNISSGSNEFIDKVLLQLHCLAWSSKIYALHVNSFNAARLILLEYDLRIEDFPLIPVILQANDPNTDEIDHYKEIISSLAEYFSSYYQRKDSVVTTWSENLKLTGEVIEEILDYLSSVRSSVPLIYHHGHSMFHAVHLHNLFYVMLSYLTLARRKERKQPADADNRPSLSARLKSLKEQREHQDESLNDLLQTVPKINS